MQEKLMSTLRLASIKATTARRFDGSDPCCEKRSLEEVQRSKTRSQEKVCDKGDPGPKLQGEIGRVSDTALRGVRERRGELQRFDTEVVRRRF